MLFQNKVQEIYHIELNKTFVYSVTVHLTSHEQNNDLLIKKV